jgi:aminopeptidase YwaD
MLTSAQKNSAKSETPAYSKLKADLEYLASEKLQGRMTGSVGEQLASNYLESRCKEIGLQPYHAAGFSWPFSFKQGKKVDARAFFRVYDTPLSIGSDVIPLPYGSLNPIKGSALPGVDEAGNIWLLSMRQLYTAINNNAQKLMYEKAKECANLGATAVIFFNDVAPSLDLLPNTTGKFEPLSIPVVVINHKAFEHSMKPFIRKDWIDIEARLGYEDAIVSGKNIVGWLDNQAPYSILITCDYDHLGPGFTGANHNASAVASLLSLAEMIKSAAYKNYNYVFVAFSGSEIQHQGAQSFLQKENENVNQYACVLDLNMLGRLNKSRALFVSGVGTSATWPTLLSKDLRFPLQVDSSGLGFGAYSLFYHKNIPLLSFSTGYCSDYGRPEDEISKINFAGQLELTQYLSKLIGELDKMPRPSFQITTNPFERIEHLKNDIGLIPDFSYEDEGLKVAVCLGQKKAANAGILPEDIITQIAEFTIFDLDDYIKAMNKLEKGREVPLTIKRGDKEYKFFVSL